VWLSCWVYNVSMSDKAITVPKNLSSEIFREVIVIRPNTTTRQAFSITVTQRIANNGEIAMATAMFSRALDLYHEKPALIRDTANKMIYVAELIERLNKKVKNGKA